MRFFGSLASFAVSIVAASVSVASPPSGATNTLRSTADLSSYNQVTNAGKVLNFPKSVDAAISYRVVLGRLTVTGWSPTDVCEEWGPSPNGEPEFRECLRYARVWSPAVVLANTRGFIAWTLADLSGRSTAAQDLDVSTCIKDLRSYELKQETQPSQPVPALTFDRNCQAYLYKGIETKSLSPALANSNVSVEVKFGTFVKFSLANDVVVDGTLDDANQASLEANFSTDASYSQIIFDSFVRVGGDTVRLLNYPEVVYFN